MSKKKNHKKHQFKYSTPASNIAESALDSQINEKPSAVSRKAPSNAALAGVDNFDYVTGDIRRVAVLAFSFFALQLVLWFSFNHSGLGAYIYGLVKL